MIMMVLSIEQRVTGRGVDMSLVIYKYTIPMLDTFQVVLPEFADILDIQMQGQTKNFLVSPRVFEYVINRLPISLWTTMNMF